MERQKKVFVLSLPASGHVNPVSGIITELVKKNVHVIMYSNEEYKSLIERTGAEYRQYNFKIGFDNLFECDYQKTKNTFFELYSKLVKISNNLVADLVKEVEKEKPDILIYDTVFSIISLTSSFP
mgnify:FL=1